MLKKVIGKKISKKINLQNKQSKMQKESRIYFETFNKAFDAGSHCYFFLKLNNLLGIGKSKQGNLPKQTKRNAETIHYHETCN